MASKHLQPIRIERNEIDFSKKQTPVLDSTDAVQASQTIDNVRNNFVVAVDHVSTPAVKKSTTVSADAMRTARSTVLDGWKLTENRQNQLRIPSEVQFNDSEIIPVKDNGSSLSDTRSSTFSGGQINVQGLSSKTNRTPSITSKDEFRMTDRRRISRLLPKKKHRQPNSPPLLQPPGEIQQPTLRINGAESTKHGPYVVDALGDSTFMLNRVSQTTDSSTKQTIENIYAMQKKTPLLLSNGPIVIERPQKLRLLPASPRSVSIYTVHNRLENGQHVGVVHPMERAMSNESENDDAVFQNRNQFMTSSLRETATHGRRVRRITSRRQLRHSMSEMGYGKLQSYRKLELIGEGTYATVYKGYSMLLEKMVALKEIRMEKTEGAPCTAIREISLLRYLRHANIVTLHDVVFTENSLTLVFEYVGQDLRNYMESYKNRLPLKTVKLFMFQIFRALEFCHASRILHRDLKPQNLLITKNQELKLADFGLARAKSIPTKTYSSEVATLWYRPPDVLLGDRNYSGHIDIWGAGCIFYEMVTGRTPFSGESKESQIKIIFQKLGIPPEAYWPGLRQNEKFQQLVLSPDIEQITSVSSSISPSGTKRSAEEIQVFTNHLRDTFTERVNRLDRTGIDLLTNCLHLLGSRRITAAGALVHPYFDGILPKGVQVQDLSPEQSVLVSHEEVTRAGMYRYKMESGQMNFSQQKKIATSMEDVRVVTQPTQSEVYRKVNSFQRPSKAMSRSMMNVFPLENSDLIQANGTRRTHEFLQANYDGQISNGLPDSVLGAQTIKKHTSPGAQSRSDQSSVSRLNGRHVKFEVVGCDFSANAKVVAFHQPCEQNATQESKTYHIETRETLPVTNHNHLSTADSSTSSQPLTSAQRPGTPIQIVREHDRSVKVSRSISGTPTQVRSLSSKTLLPSTKMKSHSINWKSPSKSSIMIINGNTLPREPDFVENPDPPLLLDRIEPNGFTRSHSPIMVTIERSYEPTKYPNSGVFGTNNRGPTKKIPFNLNNQTPAYVRIKDTNECKQASVANSVDSDRLTSTDDSTNVSFDGAIEMLDRICQ
ncbi:Cyclin-dependent kinase 18 [Fasciola hepatica]|uniref:cyclin-dependent kinase n=1 Tax=Fasciola hepatica TaxID=6192 RepID=A0A4E0RY72_FASHE|nr:Cyclin-dependent kinase 18 [Fasciola hepatica]